MIANFKIRCSAIGHIMTDGRSSGLSKTTISYLDDWAKEQIYGRRKKIDSKYIEKGIIMEDAAIDFVSESYPEMPFLLKNKTDYKNEYMTGTPDIIIPGEIIDIKCSWDCFTFPLFEQDIPEKNYYWQMQGYMTLVGRDRARVIYCLMDTPQEIVDREIRFNPDAEVEIIQYHSYRKIPVKYRIKEFLIYRNNEDIARIETRVQECREYITKL